MGGSGLDENWDLTESSAEVRNLILVGRTGNGKSATGNSILGKKAFTSRSSSFGVTSTCEMQRTVLRDGQVLNVIDTPGLFDFSMDAKYVCNEIVKCIRVARVGIHAVVIVFSVRTRFSEEDNTALKYLQIFFGPKLVNYMIINVFTGGDDLESNGQSLEDYIGCECPETIKEILRLCKNRLVVFNNKTNKESVRQDQVQQLIELVNKVIMENGGQPYADEFFNELQEGVLKLNDQEKQIESLEGAKQEVICRSFDELLKRITEMIEKRLGESIRRLEQQLAEERAARLKAEQSSQQHSAEEKAARLRAETVSLEQLSEERAARLAAEKLLGEARNARLEAELRAHKLLNEEKAARSDTEKHYQEKLEAEKAATREAEKVAEKLLEEARAALLNVQKSFEEAKRNKCIIL